MLRVLYLSGPMTGLPELNFPAFHAAAAQLRAAGFLVVNPAELCPEPGASWVACMRTDIKALCDCDGVALLPGWTNSRGARLEVQVAEALEMTLWNVPQWLRSVGVEVADAP